ncbi:MAG TPA: nucleotidyltransferase family protein [Anaerolineales bacterium]|nr:nucleotidyltransferase family protein [Anaerolineales bacterium]
MSRKSVLDLLKKHQTELRKLGVRSLALFGSVARDQAGPDSDVDLLVEFMEAPNFDRFIDVKIYLEDLIGCRVDLVMPQSVRPQMRPYIEQDLVYVA